MTENQKQEFIGGLVASALAKKGIEVVIDKALKKVAASPSTKMTQADVPAATELVTKKVQEEVQARVEYATNTEPWYQSRTIIGSSMAIMGAVVTCYTLWNNGVADGWEVWQGPVGVLLGAGFAFYGRVFKSKPLGR